MVAQTEEQTEEQTEKEGSGSSGARTPTATNTSTHAGGRGNSGKSKQDGPVPRLELQHALQQLKVTAETSRGGTSTKTTTEEIQSKCADKEDDKNGAPKLEVVATAAWWSAAGPNITLRVSTILNKLQRHEDQRVWLARVLCSFALLATCVPHRLPQLVLPATNVLMAAVTDNRPRIAHAALHAHATLTAAGTNITTTTTTTETTTTASASASAQHDSAASLHTRQRRRALVRDVESSVWAVLQRTLQRLPRCCRTGTDDDILFALRELGGCLRLLTPHTAQRLRSSGGVQQFVAGICTILTFDVDEYDTLVADAIGSTEAGRGESSGGDADGDGDGDEESENSRNTRASPMPRFTGVRKVYKFHRSDAVIAAAHNACQLLAMHPACLRGALQFAILAQARTHT